MYAKSCYIQLFARSINNEIMQLPFDLPQHPIGHGKDGVKTRDPAEQSKNLTQNKAHTHKAQIRPQSPRSRTRNPDELYSNALGVIGFRV